jgi:hypothetical protein
MRTLVLAIAVAGCTSSGAGGTVKGGTFTPADSISASITTPDGAGGSSSDAQIDLASTPHLCSDASASPPIARKGQRFITILLRDVNGAMTTTPTAPGTYTIYPDSGTEPAKSASLLVGALDSTCQPDDTAAAQAQSGTVTLTSVTGGTFIGSFAVTLNTGASLTGTFDPEPCTELATGAANSSAPACM